MPWRRWCRFTLAGWKSCPTTQFGFDFTTRTLQYSQHLSHARSVHSMVPILGTMQLEGDTMSARSRVRWDRHVDQVIRSQHYTWLGEGLAGEPLSSALTDIMA